MFLNKIQKEIFRKINLKVPDDTSSKPKTAGRLVAGDIIFFKPKFPLLKKEIVLCKYIIISKVKISFYKKKYFFVSCAPLSKLKCTPSLFSHLVCFLYLVKITNLSKKKTINLFIYISICV